MKRVIALGASNLTRGLPAVVATAREAFGPDVELLVAQGLGRSYGTSSRVFVRTLPGILESGLWRQLDALPEAPARAVISDVGNDILYGASPPQIVDWVGACVSRLERHTRDIVLTDLPLTSIRRRSSLETAVFRSLLFPWCRLSPAAILQRVEEVTEGLHGLALSRGLRLFPLRAEWYGFDPIHIRPAFWRVAWREILLGEDGGGPTSGGVDWREALRLYTMLPERQWLLGLEQVALQSGVALPAGGRVWLY